MRIKIHTNILSCRVAMVSQGIIELIANKPFRKLVANLSNNPIHLPQNVFVGVGDDLQNRIVSFSGEEEESVNSIYSYKESENEDMNLG